MRLFNCLLFTIEGMRLNSYRLFIFRYSATKKFNNFMEPIEPVEDLLMSSKRPSSDEKPPTSESQKNESSEPQKSVESSPTKRKNRLMNLQSYNEMPPGFMRSESEKMDNFDQIMTNNKIWAKMMVEEDPDFFNSLVDVQRPEYLWIGCSDSRVPANQIVGLKAGEVFVHRNVANQAPPSDINVLAVVQYAVQVLKVTDIMVTGHYGCGGIRAAFALQDHGPLESWLSYIRDLRWRYRKELILPTDKQNEDLLCELNVKQQVYNIARFPIVQKAWKDDQKVRIHGLIYSLKDGLLKDLEITLSKLEHLPEEFRIT